MAIEIVDLPIKNGGSFNSYVNVETRPGTMGFIPSKAMTGGPDPKQEKFRGIMASLTPLEAKRWPVLFFRDFYGLMVLQLGHDIDDIAKRKWKMWKSWCN